MLFLFSQSFVHCATGFIRIQTAENGFNICDSLVTLIVRAPVQIIKMKVRSPRDGIKIMWINDCMVTKKRRLFAEGGPCQARGHWLVEKGPGGESQRSRRRLCSYSVWQRCAAI